MWTLEPLSDFLHSHPETETGELEFSASGEIAIMSVMKFNEIIRSVGKLSNRCGKESDR